MATTCASARAWARWTLELLAGALVRSTEQEHLSRETVRQRHIERHGVTPPCSTGASPAPCGAWDSEWRSAFESAGGERGIRTLDTVARIHAFQACAFNHSATSPTTEP